MNADHRWGCVRASCSWHPSGQRFLSADRDGGVHVWSHPAGLPAANRWATAAAGAASATAAAAAGAASATAATAAAAAAPLVAAVWLTPATATRFVVPGPDPRPGPAAVFEAGLAPLPAAAMDGGWPGWAAVTAAGQVPPLTPSNTPLVPRMNPPLTTLVPPS